MITEKKIILYQRGGEGMVERRQESIWREIRDEQDNSQKLLSPAGGGECGHLPVGWYRKHKIISLGGDLVKVARKIPSNSRLHSSAGGWEMFEGRDDLSNKLTVGVFCPT